MIFFYIFLEFLLLPFILIYILFNKKTRKSFFLRMGFSLPEERDSILFHTVSVGEFLAAKSLIKKMMENDKKFYISTVTLTGKEMVLKEKLPHIFFPFDFPLIVENFLNSLKPRVVFIFETEIWPYFILKCSKKNIPVIIINGRISDKSFKKYKKLRFFFKKFFEKIELVLAQSIEDGERFKYLGSKNVKICGNLKFDIKIKEIPGEIKKFYDKFADGRSGWVAGSTLRGEEEIILRAHKEILNKYPQFFLILAPRHPERTQEVEKIISSSGLSYIKRSNFPEVKKTDVLLVDTIGELGFLYSYGKIAFVGGSLVEKGGHNILEPAYFKVPIIIGPNYSNFKEIVNIFLKEGALIIQNKENFSILSLLDMDLRETGEKGFEVLEKNKGSLEDVYKILKEYLK